MPAFLDNLAVVYNKKIFDDAGVDYPSDDWTWDDFLATAAELNDPAKGIAGFAWPGTGDEDTTWRIWPLIWQQGGDIVSEDGTSVAFDGPEGEAALDVVAQAAADELGLHRLLGRQRAHAAAVHQRQDGDERRRPVRAAGVRRRRASTTGSCRCRRSAATTRRSRGPDTWAIFDNGEAEVAGGGRVPRLVQPARAAAALDRRGGQPAADHRRRGAADDYADYEGSLPELDKFVANTDLARVRPTVAEYPQISQAMGQAIASGALRRGRPGDGARGGGRHGERRARGSVTRRERLS